MRIIPSGLYEIYKPLLKERDLEPLFYEIEMPLVGDCRPGARRRALGLGGSWQSWERR